MKRIALLFGVVLAVSFVAFAADEKTKKDDSAKAGGDQHVAFSPEDLKWGDAPPALPSGAKLAVLEGNPSEKGPFCIRLQMPAGYRIPPHTHPTTEHVTVISGSPSFGMGPKFDEAAGKQLSAGGYIVMPAGMQHYAWSASGEAVVQVHGTGPFQITYVNPADDPRTAKK